VHRAGVRASVRPGVREREAGVPGVARGERAPSRPRAYAGRAGAVVAMRERAAGLRGASRRRRGHGRAGAVAPVREWSPCGRARGRVAASRACASELRAYAGRAGAVAAVRERAPCGRVRGRVAASRRAGGRAAAGRAAASRLLRLRQYFLSLLCSAPPSPTWLLVSSSFRF